MLHEQKSSNYFIIYAAHILDIVKIAKAKFPLRIAEECYLMHDARIQTKSYLNRSLT